MSEIIQIFTILPASQAQLYHDWLDSEAHGAFTGYPACIDPRVGGEFTAYDGYILGSTAILEPEYHIVQRWRTTDFAETDEDSILDILLIPEGDGTRLVLTNSHLPAGREDEFEQGWEDYYFAPMQGYYQHLFKQQTPG